MVHRPGDHGAHKLCEKTYKDNGWNGARSYESKVIHREGAELGDGVG
jgi:hypothetical protein